jgi:Putative zinc-finger
MENVPNIVRQRLKAAASGANHPDADLLTAFAEKSLPERERGSVLEHLARCGDCRDVLALALPATESTTTVVSPSPTRWLTWPALRWAVVAAGVAVVASLGIFQLQHRSAQTAMLARAVPIPQIATTVQPEPASASTSERKKSADKAPAADHFSASVATKLPEPRLTAPKLPEPGAPALAAPPAAQAQSGAMHGNGIGGGIGSGKSASIGGPTRSSPAFGPKMPAQWQQQQPGQSVAGAQVFPAAPSGAAKQASRDMAANANPPQSSETAEISMGASNVAEIPTPQAAAPSEINAQSSENADLRVGKAKAAFAPRPEAIVASSHPIARWSISSAGGLQRSLDQGGTWQDVDVTANAASSAFEFSSSVPATDKDANTKLLKSKAQTAAPVFRAVVATGIDVWAGGSAGALYHSVDGGNRWKLVTPSVAGSVLIGDIVALDFSDAQHGRISTSTGEVWITRDDGQTWQKQ